MSTSEADAGRTCNLDAAFCASEDNDSSLPLETSKYVFHCKIVAQINLTVILINIDRYIYIDGFASRPRISFFPKLILSLH